MRQETNWQVLVTHYQLVLAALRIPTIPFWVCGKMKTVLTLIITWSIYLLISHERRRDKTKWCHMKPYDILHLFFTTSIDY